METSSVKEQKEAFVTGHDGTTPWELLLVCLSAPMGVWLFQLLNNIICSSAKTSSLQWRQQVGIEAIVLLFPMALCQTNLLYPWGVAVLFLEGGIALFLVLRSITSRQPTETKEAAADTTTTATRRLDFVTCYRSTVSYLTFVAILAVDFHVFPRRFAKTEVYGYGLMDLGAGSFVVSAGLVSPRARGKENQTAAAALQRMLPLVFLGMIRLLTNKGLEYQEHVSEYGVHWNFFFTLAMLSPLASLWKPHQSWMTVMMVLGAYQLALSRYGLQEYVEEAPRQCKDGSIPILCDVFAANREGIMGCVGYLSLYVLSEYVGKLCLWTNGDNNDKKGVSLFSVAALLWFLHWFLSNVLYIQASRRTTNATFCSWTAAHNILMLAFMWAAMHGFGQQQQQQAVVPPIFKAVNRHGLLVFVVANLLTGVVNLSINTLEASDGQALLIVFGYLCVVGGFALLADYLLSGTRQKIE